MKLKDLLGLFKTRKIEFVKSENSQDNYYVFYFKKEDLNWEAGEHGIFSIKKKFKDRKWRGFSVASHPREDLLFFATTIDENPSPYKQELLKLKSGEKIKLRGPFGWFKFQDDQSPAVMITGGVGITPIRALYKELEADNKRTVTLIYSSKNHHLFEMDLKRIAEKDNKITNYFLRTREEVSKELEKKIQEFGNQAYYFISGSPAMIKEITQKLKSRKISGRRIINDPFIGY